MHLYIHVYVYPHLAHKAWLTVIYCDITPRTCCRPTTIQPMAQGIQSEAGTKRPRITPPPPVKPALSAFNVRHSFGDLGVPWFKPSLITPLDTFLRAAPSTDSRADTMLRYLISLPDSQNNSQRLEASLSYLYFAGDMCPILYDAAFDAWYVYDYYWKTSRNSMGSVSWPTLRLRLMAV